ncbi:hypothetical protein NPIL_3341 [Nephila pilipes]|uniref:Uncharacterized protein n=1 Tax=Nephila pilipes TaxID=299642 RepID=A0A8X6UTJ8_NEPPI|nr:hypothetical protein NPIL_3341 [Nephila pilipes]
MEDPTVFGIIGEDPNPNLKITYLVNLIQNSKHYKEENAKALLETIVAVTLEEEKQKIEEEERQKEQDQRQKQREGRLREEERYREQEEKHNQKEEKQMKERWEEQEKWNFS